jgi:cellulose synthase/poly-beta-1,6-N-acetylglucosamine synthase-like glycosyltransferase
MEISSIYPIFFWVFAASAIIQIIYFWLIFSRFAFYKEKKKSSVDIPVSVIICAKNEYHNLKEFLPLILEQDYPDFEVVVVNDASDDETIFFLEDMERKYGNLKIITLMQDLNFFSGKKFPLSVGIKSAKNEHLLLTDADCRPAGKNWIREMAGRFDTKKEIVLGYGAYNESPGFLNKIIRYETATTALQYFSYALSGIPYMGVGRNLAYKKELFIKSKGFISHYNVASGDDDLFVNKVANSTNTAICISKDSFTYSKPQESVRTWFRQKRRHLSAGKYYKFKHLFLLGTWSMSTFLFYLLFVFLLSVNFMTVTVLSLFAVRVLSQLIIYKKTFNRLNEKKLLLISPLVEVILLILYPVIIISNLFVKQNRWK